MALRHKAGRSSFADRPQAGIARIKLEEIECEQQGLRFDARRWTCSKSRQ